MNQRLAFRLFLIICTICGMFLSCQSREEQETSIEKSKAWSIPISQIDTNKLTAVRLPRPNSFTYSFEEAEKRKDEIYDMELTPKHFAWQNPTSGGALHINKQDEIEVYQFTMGLMFVGKGVDEMGDSIVYVDRAPKDTSFVIQQEEIKRHVAGIGLGNPASVLITSELELKKSKSLALILDEVFEPGTQIYYLKKR